MSKLALTNTHPLFGRAVLHPLNAQRPIQWTMYRSHPRLVIGHALFASAKEILQNAMAR